MIKYLCVYLALCPTWMPIVSLPEATQANAESLTPRFRQPDPNAFPDLYAWTDTCNVYVLRNGDTACGELVELPPQDQTRLLHQVVRDRRPRQQRQDESVNGGVCLRIEADEIVPTVLWSHFRIGHLDPRYNQIRAHFKMDEFNQ